MRILIETAPVGRLNVLRELPEARIAIIEGLNGIGKTLAVRLLQACVGTAPYRNESLAWQSFCLGLGPFKVTASGLNGAAEMIWVADTRDWADTPVAAASHLKFKQLSVDGTAASMEEVRALLSVHRLGGEEGILETLAQDVDEDAIRVRRWTRRYADPTSGPLARLEAVVAEAISTVGEWSLEKYQRLTLSAEDARSRVSLAMKETEEARSKRDELVAIAELRDRLLQMRERTPELSERLREIDTRRQRLEAEREQLQQNVRSLAGEVATTQPLLRELANARRTVERHQFNLAIELNTAAILARQLGGAADNSAVSGLLAELARRVEELSQLRTALDTAPAMRRLLDRIIAELSAAESAGLGDQVALDDPETEIQLTVTHSRVAAVSRRAVLEGRPPPPEAQQVIEQLERTRRSLAQAEELQARLAEAQRLRRLIAQNEERVNRALTAINPKAVAEIDELEARRRAVDEQLLQMAAERAALAQQLGAFGDETTQEALGAQLSQRLEEAGVVESNLDATGALAENMLRQSAESLTRARDTEAALKRELARSNAEIQRSAVALATNTRLTWMRDGESAAATTPIQQLAAIDGARLRAEVVNDRLGELRDQLGAVESALEGIGRHLRGRPPDAAEYLPELEAWFGMRFSEWFNNTRVRKELLPDADGPAVVNVSRREVIWTEGKATHSRPLEAFSSGEQAFAYTRARLGVLDEAQTKPLNRLIVLDEFGAFIAHDRLQGLLGYLRDRAGEHPEDQVLVVLPLSRDYAELASGSFGTEAERYGQLAGEIRSRSYAVQILAS